MDRESTHLRGYPNPIKARPFFRDVVAWSTSVTPRVLPLVLVFGALSISITVLWHSMRWEPFEVSHVQYTGAALVLLLVLRTNASYDRWWEARKLWGGIVNQSRNLALRVVHYGRSQSEFREPLLRWIAAYPHACRRALRSQREAPELRRLLGDAAESVIDAPNMPLRVAGEIATRLRRARESDDVDGFALMMIDRELALLVDYVGACERILRTPLPLVHRVKLRRFIFLYLGGVAVAAAPTEAWLTPVITMLVAYPLLAIDQIAQELETPFDEGALSHLPLDAICKTIEENVITV